MKASDYLRLQEKLATTIAVIEQQIPVRFPLYRIAGDTDWVTSARGSWGAGFWAGCCWLAGYFSKQSHLAEQLGHRWEQLTSGLETQSVFRSMNAWYGFGPALCLSGDMQASQGIARFQQQLAQSFAPWQGFPLGTDMGGGEAGNFRLSVDPCAALIELGRHHGWQKMPMAHAHLTAGQLINAAGAVHTLSEASSGSHIPEKWQWHPVGPAGSWLRGQSWGMLAMCSAAVSDRDTFKTLAQQVCQYQWEWLIRDQEDAIGTDPSAVLMSAVAFFKLNEICGESSVWWERGLIALRQVLAHSSLTETEQTLHFSGCRYTVSTDKATSGSRQQLTEMPYGYFFLYQALLIVSGTIKASIF